MLFYMSCSLVTRFIKKKTANKCKKKKKDEDFSHMAFPHLPIVNEVVLCGLSGLLLSWDLALG